MIKKKLVAETTEVLFTVTDKIAVSACNDFNGGLTIKFYSGLSLDVADGVSVGEQGKIASTIKDTNYSFVRQIHSSDSLCQDDKAIINLIRPLYNE